MIIKALEMNEMNHSEGCVQQDDKKVQARTLRNSNI